MTEATRITFVCSVCDTKFYDTHACFPPMPASPTADDLWMWLRSCSVCDKIHECRELTNHKPGSFRPTHVTWADPDDGHAYRRRSTLFDIDQLQDEWNRKNTND